MLSRGSFKTRRETKTCIRLIVQAVSLAATHHRQYNHASGDQMATTAYFIPYPYAVLHADRLRAFSGHFILLWFYFIFCLFFIYLFLVLGNFAVIGDLFL